MNSPHKQTCEKNVSKFLASLNENAFYLKTFNV